VYGEIMDYKQLITIEPDKRSGQPCIRGLRMTVQDVLEYLASGMSIEEILADFPDLTAEDIRACLAFAADQAIEGACGCIAHRGRKGMNSSEQTRQELLTALAQLSRIRPEWRLGQLIANLAMTAGRLDSGVVWDLEDVEALAAANTLIEHYSEIEPEIAEPAGTPDRGDR
jgi:uncharacterized protein (DUF433 family)